MPIWEKYLIYFLPKTGGTSIGVGANSNKYGMLKIRNFSDQMICGRTVHTWPCQQWRRHKQRHTTDNSWLHRLFCINAKRAKKRGLHWNLTNRHSEVHWRTSSFKKYFADIEPINCRTFLPHKSRLLYSFLQSNSSFWGYLFSNPNHLKD